MKCPDTTNNFTSPGTMFMLVPISMISVHYCLTVLLDYCMTVARTSRPQYSDVMIDVISHQHSNGIHALCRILGDGAYQLQTIVCSTQHFGNCNIQSQQIENNSSPQVGISANRAVTVPCVVLRSGGVLSPLLFLLLFRE